MKTGMHPHTEAASVLDPEWSLLSLCAICAPEDWMPNKRWVRLYRGNVAVLAVAALWRGEL